MCVDTTFWDSVVVSPLGPFKRDAFSGRCDTMLGIVLLMISITFAQYARIGLRFLKITS
jgi:hypothetical protein